VISGTRPVLLWTQDLADPCAEFFVKAYVNDPQVKAAIHANGGANQPWSRCAIGRYDLFHFGDSPKTMLPHLKDIISSGIRVWIFRFFPPSLLRV
jgi:serine carboxypeptidase-like clade II